MKKYKFVLTLAILVFFIDINVYASSKGYYDLDQLEDQMNEEIKDDYLHICIEFGDKKKPPKCFDTYTSYGANSMIYSEKRGELILHGSCCGRQKRNEILFHRYS